MKITSRYVVVAQADIDTDQIIPARFLKTTSRAGLGAHLFADRRQVLDGAGGAAILVAGDNFGCGSSREHAPWALLDFGFRAVVSTSFADIFRQNALGCGLLPVVVTPGVHARLLDAAGSIMTIDLAAREMLLPWGERATFPIDPFAARCLLGGMDELDYLLSLLPQVERHEAGR